MLGQRVTVTVDRPLGSAHPEYPDVVYPVNYGYIEGITAGDGEEQDAYVLGLDMPVGAVDGTVIAIIHRENDVEDKWVVSPGDVRFTKTEIAEKVAFIERFFQSWIEVLDEAVTEGMEARQKWEYAFVNIDYDGEGRLLLGGNMTEHRDVIQEYARRGYRYVGMVPTTLNTSGYFRRMDLIFEKECLK